MKAASLGQITLFGIARGIIINIEIIMLGIPQFKYALAGKRRHVYRTISEGHMCTAAHVCTC